MTHADAKAAVRTGPMVFVVNPQSANGATRRRFDRVRGQFENGIDGVDVRLTEGPRHATELTRQALLAGARAVISVGGDGTNNEVVNGFFDAAGALVAPGAAFGVVTSGTGGDFRRTFGWSTDPLDDLARLKRFSTRLIDVGKTQVTGHDGVQRTLFFVNIASFGVSGSVVDVVNHSSKALGARLSFMLGSLRAMVGYSAPRVRLQLDGGAVSESQVTFVAISNAQYFGGGMWVAPQAQPDDGVFDCVTVTGAALPFFALHGLKIYAGKHTNVSTVDVKRCAKVYAEALGGARVLVEIDGEQPGVLPATFEIVPSVLPLLV